MIQQVFSMMAKDFRIELRQRYAINSILLYVLSTVFLAYLSLQGAMQIPEKYLAAVFWIILTFAAVNSVSKSFIQENEYRHNYYYMLMKANTALLSKMIYNSVLLLLVSLSCFAVFSVFLKFNPENILIFITGLLLGSIGYSSVLTMVSAIAAKTNANFALVAILGFPLLLPLLLLLIRITDVSLITGAFADALRYLLLSFAQKH